MPRSDSNQYLKKRHGYVLSIFNNDFSNYVNKEKFEGFVNALLRYFLGDVSENDFGFFEEGKVKSHSFSKLTNSLKYICACLNKINNLPLDIIKSARKLNSLIRTKSVETKVINISLYELLFSSLDVINSTIKIIPDDRSKTPRNETIAVYLKNEVVDFGKIILTLSTSYHSFEKIEENIVELIQIAITNKHLNPVQANNLRYAFLKEYQRGRDIINKCDELFKTKFCYSPEVTDLYSNISKGYSYEVSNVNEIISLLVDDNLTTLCKGSDNIPIVNFLQYFKTHVANLNKINSGISTKFLDDTSLFIKKLGEYLIENDIKKTRIYGNIFLFVTETLKDPHLSISSFWIFTPAIYICKDIINHLFKEKFNINPTVKLYANIHRQINEIKWFNFEYRLSFASVLKDLMLNCLEQPNCDAKFTLNEFLDVFGHIIKSNVLSVENITEIEKFSIEVFKKAQTKLDEADLLSIARSFLSPYVQKTNISVKCNGLFNLTHCQEFIPANQTAEQDIDTTTLIPKTITNETITHPVTTVTPATTIPTVIPLHSNKTIIPVNTTTEASLTTIGLPVNVSSISSNQATIDTYTIENMQLADKIGTAMGLGALTGFLNGGSQVILHIAEQKNCSSNTQRLLAVTLALANSFSISTLPLVYAIVENLANEEADSLVNSQKILTCTYAFLTSVALQGLNYGLNYALPKKSILKNLFNMLPLFAGLWMLANSDEGIIEHLTILGANILTAIAVSSMTFFSFNRCVSSGNRQSSDIETVNTKVTYDVHNNEVEMQSLNNKKINGVKKSGDDGFEYSIKTYQYITPEKFDEVKKCSKELLEALTKVKASLSESITNNKNAITENIPPTVAETYEKIIDAKSHVLKIITVQTTSMDMYVKHLNDEIHHDADKYHNDKKLYNEAMEKLGNVFKLMVPMLNTMKTELNGAKGYIDGKKANFAEILGISKAIDDIMNYIPIPLSLYNIYLKKYSDSEMLEQAEKNGAKKALQNHERFNSTATNFRQPNNRNISNRVCSMYSDRTRSSGSDISGNSEFDPLVEQQQRDLISP